jgi:hypothetical protein
MAKRDADLIIESLSQRWNAVSTPSAGTSCVASVSPLPNQFGGNWKANCDSLGWSVRNLTAAAVTTTLEVRDASIAGGVIASWDFVVAANGGAADNFAVKVQGVRGNPLYINFGTPNVSVVQKVSAAGWYDTLHQ